MEQHAQNGYSMDAVADDPWSEACHDMIVYDADGEHRPHTACGTGIVATLLSMISARGRKPIDYGIVRQRETETKEGRTSGRWQAKKDDAGSPASPHMTLSSSSAEQPRFNVEPPRAQPSPCLLLASCPLCWSPTTRSRAERPLQPGTEKSCPANCRPSRVPVKPTKGEEPRPGGAGLCTLPPSLSRARRRLAFHPDFYLRPSLICWEYLRPH